MNGSAREQLGLSEIIISHYAPPSTVLEITVFTLVTLTFCAFIFSWSLLPGSFIYDYILSPYTPSWFIKFCRVIRPWLLGGMAVIHTGEMVWFERREMRPFRVREGSWVWWAWMGSVFIEGVGARWRFGREVEERRRREEREKGKEKH